MDECVIGDISIGTEMGIQSIRRWLNVFFLLIFWEDWVVLGDSVEDFFFGRENYRLHGGRTFVSLAADDLV